MAAIVHKRGWDGADLRTIGSSWGRGILLRVFRRPFRSVG